MLDISLLPHLAQQPCLETRQLKCQVATDLGTAAISRLDQEERASEMVEPPTLRQIMLGDKENTKIHQGGKQAVML